MVLYRTLYFYMRAQGGGAAKHFPPPIFRTLYKVLRGGGPKKNTTK